MQFSSGKPAVLRALSAGTVLTLALLAMAVIASPAAAAPQATVDKQVLDEISARASTRFLVYLKARADLTKAPAQRSKNARAEYVYRQLTTTATTSQSGLTAVLKQNKISHESFWIANALAVTGDKAVVDSIAARADVASIEAIKIRPIVKPVVKPAGNAVNAVEWGLSNIEAPRVWSEYGIRGEGVVIANIDSGVQFDHPALVGKYRGNLGGGTFDHDYNWFDPSQVCGQPSLAPCDNNGHGTHTMGTMVGDDGAGNQIGVAPGARWIAAKGCETTGCTDTALLASGQWVLAPTDLGGQNPRPDLRADIVNNSWSGGPGDTFYQATVQAWIAAGIMPIFSVGNTGPGCDTANSPGDNPETYAVGAYDANNQIADFSGRGESQLDGAIKPNIAAPGVEVRSSVPGNAYATYDGTSMAAPHVAGTVALVWSAAPLVRGNVAATRTLLDEAAVDTDALGCGGTVDFNNTFGEGRLNAYQALLAAPRGPVGRVGGTVTDAASGEPLAGATVTDGDVTAITGAGGRYTLASLAGEHTVTASKFGYADKSAPVTVTEGATVTQDFALTRVGNLAVSGRVLDGSGHGWPLYARIEIPGRPGGPVFTDPVTGAYTVDLPASATHTMTVTALYPGYQPKTVEVVVGGTAVTLDITLEVSPACTAPGYALLAETFDAPITPAGWAVVKRNPTGAEWAFNDPGGRGNQTGGSGGFAIADGDAVGAGTTTDTDLITPALDLSGEAGPALRFNSDFRDLGSEDFADIDVSTDGGATWTTVWHQTDSRRGPRVEEVSLAAYAGQANVKLRFHYFGTWDWWWQVDNVYVVDRSCDPVPGGLVVGFTTDANTGAPLTGVTVTSDDNPADKGVSTATPEDPNLPDGFYWLFSRLTGAHPFTAAVHPYQSATITVTVVVNSTVRADFALNAIRLSVTPTRIETYLTLGQARSTTITVTNNGSVPTPVTFVEVEQGGAAGDVPWLSEDPAAFTLSPGASQTVTVAIAATAEAGITQPGDHAAQITVRSNSPYPVDTIAVVMHVLPPANWGKIVGTVRGQHCNGDLVALPAQLEIARVGSPDMSYPLLANADGTYAIWLPQGRYDVIASMGGWRSQAKRHQVRAGFAETLDFTLQPFGACGTPLP